MAKVKTQFVCQNCGYISPRYLGRCPNCNEWNTLVEETVAPKTVPWQQRVCGEMAFMTTNPKQSIS